MFNKVHQGAADLASATARDSGGPARRPAAAPSATDAWNPHPSPHAARAHAATSSREFISKFGLIALLLLLPVAYGIQDLQDDGNLGRLATNIKDGLSNGAIWALIAVGYTLVYGIIELINFAHGDLFMIGTFIASR